MTDHVTQNSRIRRCGRWLQRTIVSAIVSTAIFAAVALVLLLGATILEIHRFRAR